MGAISDIAKINKHKLKLFQKEINILRNGSLSDKTIEEWKSLYDNERKIKITVFLSMAMLPEKDLERIAKVLDPWWEPYQKIARVLTVIFIVFLAYQLTTFFLAKRVYPKMFEFDTVFTDGSVKNNRLFEGSSMIYKDTDSGAVLLDVGIIDWLLMRSKKTNYDSTVWTVNEDLHEELKNFYAGFQYNTLMSGELKKVPLSVESIYEAAVKVTGSKKIKMDLYVPAKFSNDHLPFFQFTYQGIISFFLSVTEGSKYWNIKIDFRGGKPIKWEELLFYPTFQKENQQKVIWDKDQKLNRPASKIIFKDANDSASNNYFIYNLETSTAMQ